MYGITLTDRDRKVLLSINFTDEGFKDGIEPIDDPVELKVILDYLDQIGLVEAKYNYDLLLGVSLTVKGRKFLLECPNAESEPDEYQKWKKQEEHNAAIEKHNRTSRIISVTGLAISLIAVALSLISLCA